MATLPGSTAKTQAGSALRMIKVRVKDEKDLELFSGEVMSDTSLNDLAVIYLPDPPEGTAYSLSDGFVKSPQTVALSDLTDEDEMTLVASYKVFPKKE